MKNLVEIENALKCLNLNHSELLGQQEQKELLGRLLTEYFINDIQNNGTIPIYGFGSGTTSEVTANILGRRIAEENLEVVAVVTSPKITKIAQTFSNISVKNVEEFTLQPEIRKGFDGADEVFIPNSQLIEAHRISSTTSLRYHTCDFAWFIKGCGGVAFPAEKKVAKFIKSRKKIQEGIEWIVLADSSKRVSRLSEKFAIPIAIESDFKEDVIEILSKKFYTRKITLRNQTNNTDSMFLDIEVDPDKIQNDSEKQIEEIPGVISSGLFLNNYADQIWISAPDGSVDIYLPQMNLEISR